MQHFRKTDILLVSSGEQKDTLTKPDLLIIGSLTHKIILFVKTKIYFANNYTNTKEQIIIIPKANTTEGESILFFFQKLEAKKFRFSLQQKGFETSFKKVSKGQLGHCLFGNASVRTQNSRELCMTSVVKCHRAFECPTITYYLNFGCTNNPKFFVF
ncbi:hypothetical protein BLM37_03940 [Candidatus Gracilibacteria bacterium GN02-873]|nr:hypothetical protein BLM37_03940 [Candidatus Gracilibacteria bacterium GN02-873]